MTSIEPATEHALKRHARLATVTSAVASLFLLPLLSLQPHSLSKVICASLGSLVSIAGLSSHTSWRKLDARYSDLEAVDKQQTIVSYQQQLKEPAKAATAPVDEALVVIEDVVSYWQSQDKHLLIVGGTGAGKSTFVQAFASQLSSEWSFSIYDSDCTIDDWSYLRTRFASFVEELPAIETAMADDLLLLEQRMSERKKVGNSWDANPKLIVAEEFPLLVSDLPTASKWMPKLAKRGRRTRLFMALVAQNSTVSNLGLKGDISLRDSCFVVVLLGQKAIERARQQKNLALVTWLEQGGKSVCLVDDCPALRPQ